MTDQPPTPTAEQLLVRLQRAHHDLVAALPAPTPTAEMTEVCS